MTILLTQNLRVGGVVLNSGTTQTFGADLEADIVARKGATYLTDPTPGKTVPVFATTDVTGRIRNSTAGGEVVQSFASAAVGNYRLATFGDSRSNAGSHRTTTSAAGISGEKVASCLCGLRGDMEIVFNGGISGDNAGNWNSAARVSSSQTVKDLLSATPDLVLIQYGVNDIISGTSDATIVSYLKALIDKIMGAGIPVVFESINPAGAAPVSWINGVTAAGGYGASDAEKAAVLLSVNATMQSWLAQFPKNIALYVDTSSVTTGVPGYQKTDKSYIDGTHISRKAAWPAAKLIDAAITPYFPHKYGNRLKLAYPNGLNRSFLNPTSGRAANFSAIAIENGTATAAYSLVVDDEGDLCQQYLVTVTGLGSSTAQMRFDILPDFVGATPFAAISVGDVLQSACDYYIDDGAGGAPIAYSVYGRQRVYGSPASLYTTEAGTSGGGASTDYPAPGAAERGHILTPRVAIVSGYESASMTTATALQIYVAANQLGTFRLQIKNPQFGKVA